MRDKYEIELTRLNTEMINMGSLIEHAIEKAINALINADENKAHEAIEFDDTIDQKQKDIETLCMKLLLTQQPVAYDLRNISAALKMVSDMERIGDHAADISEITLMLAKSEYKHDLDIIKKMAAETTDMVIKSVEAYVSHDTDKAKAVIQQDDVVDDLFCKSKDKIVDIIKNTPDKAGEESDLLMIAKYFERIGDHATNIAEWVIYIQTGDINIIS